MKSYIRSVSPKPSDKMFYFFAVFITILPISLFHSKIYPDNVWEHKKIASTFSDRQRRIL